MLIDKQIFLKRALDYERETEYSMVILAVDGGAEPLTGSQTLTVRVVDANDNRPMVTVNTLQSAGAGTGASVAAPGGSVDSHAVDVVENGEPGSFVAHVSAYDADSGPGGLVSFT
jgi:microcompartment protein CcmK/EutM